jgi:signal peptide peptidase-like protein 2B
MVCSKNETYTDIRIPSVMVPKSAGESLEKAMRRGEGRSRMLALVSMCQ